VTRGLRIGAGGVAVAGAATLASIAAALTVVAPAVAEDLSGYSITTSVDDVGLAPTGVAVNPVTQSVYVATPAAKGRVGSLAILDASTGELRRILFPAAEMPNPTSVAVDSVSGRVFVANPEPSSANRLTIIENDTIAGALTVGRNARWVSVDDSESPRKVYVTNYGDADVRDVSGVSIIHSTDEATEVLATTAFSPGEGVTAVAVDTDTSPHRVWAVNSNDGPHPLAGSLTMAESTVDRATFTNWSGVLPPETTPGLVAVRPVSHTLFLADLRTDEIHLVDTSGAIPAVGQPFRTQRRAGHAPIAMTYDAGIDRLFVLYADEQNRGVDGELAVLDAATGEVLQHVDLPSPGGMALDPSTGALWVTDTAHDTVHKVEDSMSGRTLLRSGPMFGAPMDSPPARSMPGDAPPPADPSGSSPTRRELPAWNVEGEPCGAVTTRPRC
jgi:DNA-binding beta-propeller fold protein YncE